MGRPATAARAHELRALRLAAQAPGAAPALRAVHAGDVDVAAALPRLPLRAARAPERQVPRLSLYAGAHRLRDARGAARVRDRRVLATGRGALAGQPGRRALPAAHESHQLAVAAPAGGVAGAPGVGPPRAVAR